MSTGIIILILLVGVSIFIATTIFLKKGRIPVKFSILWYMVSILLLLVGLFPMFIVWIATAMGFQTMSNMIIGILIISLFFMTMALTIIVSGQKTKITLLIQEISILKKELQDNEFK